MEEWCTIVENNDVGYDVDVLKIMWLGLIRAMKVRERLILLLFAITISIIVVLAVIIIIGDL